MQNKAILNSITEKQFQAQFLELAGWLGWLAYHDYDSRKNSPGFLDTVLAKRGRIIFAELKSEKGKLRPQQKIWYEILKTCPGIEVYVWKPSQWDEIVETLKRT
jgi:VRR-NUC domain